MRDTERRERHPHVYIHTLTLGPPNPAARCKAQVEKCRICNLAPEEREKVHKLCAFPWGVSAIPDEVKRMLAEDVDDDPSSAEESEELDFSCSSSSAAASNPNDPQATNSKAVSSSVAEEVLPVSFASASFAGKEAEGKNDVQLHNRASSIATSVADTVLL